MPKTSKQATNEPEQSIRSNPTEELVSWNAFFRRKVRIKKLRKRFANV